MGHGGADPADRAGPAEPGSPEGGAGLPLCGPRRGGRQYTRVVDAGFEGKTEPWDAFWGQRFAYLRDPEGNTVALFAPLG